MIFARARFAVALIAFLAWLGWLAVAVAKKGDPGQATKAIRATAKRARATIIGGSFAGGPGRSRTRS